MTDQKQIDTLKAQVNCLRAMLECILLAQGEAEYSAAFLLLSSTPEQCLAEVKAKAIEQLKTRFSFWIRTIPETHIYVEDKESDGVFDSFPQFLEWYAKELRGQAK